MPTKREYLVGLGLAQEGRGRFSREANAALESAIKDGMTFSDPTPVVAKSAAVSLGKSIRKAKSQGNVRAWARANGYEVGERGRFSAEILAAYNAGTPSTKAVESPVEFTLPVSRRVRQNKQLFGLTPEGHRVGFSSCRRCAEFMAFCNCREGLMPPSIVTMGLDGKPWRLVECNSQPWKG